MAEWKFQRENTVPDDLIPKGPIRVRIVSAEKQISKNGNDMLRIILKVSGYKQKIYHFITFMPNNQALTNRLLTQFFDSFPGIPEGEFNTAKWVGAEGAAMITHDNYNGLVTAKVSWFINRNNQAGLPAFVDVDQPIANEAQTYPSIQQQAASSIQAEIMPDGSIKLPDGRIIPPAAPVAAPEPQQEQPMGPNKSWNAPKEKSFDQAYDAFINGVN